MTYKPHFHVERHSPTEWRVVNSHIGHGLIFTPPFARRKARDAARTLNRRMKIWVVEERNPFT